MASTVFPMMLPWYSFGTVTASSGGKTVAFASSTRAAVFTIGAGASAQSMWLVSVGSTGSVVISNAKSGSSITCTSNATNQITLVNSSTSVSPNVYVVCFTGDASLPSS